MLRSDSAHPPRTVPRTRDAIYGAIVAKLVAVRSRLPGWALPVAGGTLVALVAVLWYTSALWYFNDYSLPSV